MNKIGEEKNSRIRKRVFWYSIGMILLVGIVVLAKYSLTGSATISVGVITSIIMRNVMKLKEGYDAKSSAPKWYLPLLVFTGLMTIFGGIVVCKSLTGYVYTLTDGRISSWTLFAIIAFVLVVVIICLGILKKGKPAKTVRIYIFIMTVSWCLIIAQCGGSMAHYENIKHHESFQDDMEKYEAKQKQEYSKKLVGKWVTAAIILGQEKVVEEFHADGTWQRGDADGIHSKGCWTYVGAKQIKIQETWVRVGESKSPSDNNWLMTINYLNDDEMSLRKGDYNIIYKRMKE